MGGCISIKFKIVKRRASSKQGLQNTNVSKEESRKDMQMPIRKNGIGRFVQTEEGMVIKTLRNKDEDYHQPDDSHDGQQFEQTKHKGSKDEIWFDTHVWLQSDSEDEFESVYGDFLPAIGNISIYPDGQGSPYPTTSLEDRTSPLEKKTLGEFFLTTQPQEGNSTLESKPGHPQLDTGKELLIVVHVEHILVSPTSGAYVTYLWSCPQRGKIRFAAVQGLKEGLPATAVAICIIKPQETN